MNRLNHLSLCLPDNELRAWAQSARARATLAALNGGSALPATKPFAEWTTEDLARPAEPWTAFWHGGNWLHRAYSVPRSYAEVKARFGWNFMRYVGNYQQCALVAVLIVLYKSPAALLGLIVLLKTWDWALENAPGDPSSWQHRVLMTLMWLLTWIVCSIGRVTHAAGMALMLAMGMIVVHGVFRTPQLPASGRHAGTVDGIVGGDGPGGIGSAVGRVLRRAAAVPAGAIGTGLSLLRIPFWLATRQHPKSP